MQKGSHLKFSCKACKEPIHFSLSDIEKGESRIGCPNCDHGYSFSDPTLLRQIHKFAALCEQIKDSQEILSNTSVGIDIGEHHVKIPYKLLLTRLNALLELSIGGEPMKIEFRMEPLLEGELCHKLP